MGTWKNRDFLVQGWYSKNLDVSCSRKVLKKSRFSMGEDGTRKSRFSNAYGWVFKKSIPSIRDDMYPKISIFYTRIRGTQKTLIFILREIEREIRVFYERVISLSLINDRIKQ